jgi:hypothetical protein
LVRQKHVWAGAWRGFGSPWQGIKYDEDAALAAAWLPELAALPVPGRHMPWGLSAEEAAQLGFELGRDYPQPMVDPVSQVGVLRPDKAKGGGGGGRGGDAERAHGGGRERKAEGEGNGEGERGGKERRRGSRASRQADA